MRAMRLIVLSALALVAGCGGCESCFGKPEAQDDAAFTTTTTRPDAAIPDAAPAGDEGDGGKDADASEASAPKNGPTQALPAVPRPKAPMPLGAFQSCGVYDGPLCEMKCPKGACRQECDGVNCELTCAGGYCSQVCGPGGTCRLTCSGGHCVQVCMNPEGCTKTCTGGDCQ